MKRVQYFIAKVFSQPYEPDYHWDGPFKTEVEAQRVYAKSYADSDKAFFIHKTTTVVEKVKPRHVRAKR